MPATPSTMVPLDTPMPAFDLPVTNHSDTITNRIRSSDLAGAPVLVMFICNHCPFVVHIRDQLASLGIDYANTLLQIVAISANDAVNYPDDAPDKMALEAVSAGYTFAYAYDESQEIARTFNAACTPDFFVYGADHRLVYRGQLDPSRPGNGIAVTGKDLRSALDHALAGDTAAPIEPQIPSIGCNIKWKPGMGP